MLNMQTYYTLFHIVNNDMTITFKEFVLESTIAAIKNKKININIDAINIADTKHSKERLNRPDNTGKSITEVEIVNSVEQALPAIISDLANGEISKTDDVWIHNSKSDLNIIAKLNFRKGIDNITIVTVMRKKDFRSKDKKYVI